ncbi:MAG: C40 family peptidase [Sulfurovaceae bacterium]|nr:C40 family peptidase [Sulfurovaceae bacterium]MDD5548828.1 C40 family peptidase [Sulfurovaceae bacterium]
MSRILEFFIKLLFATFILAFLVVVIYLLLHNSDTKNIDLQPTLKKEQKYLDKDKNSSTFIKQFNKKDKKIQTLISFAESKLGSNYKEGAVGPDSFDCSGFIYYVFKQNGIVLPRTSIDQSLIGEKLNKDEINKGDILFFDTAERGHVNHSGLYLGDNKFIHASSGKAKSIIVSELDYWYKDKFLWGVRVFH